MAISNLKKIKRMAIWPLYEEKLSSSFHNYDEQQHILDDAEGLQYNKFETGKLKSTKMRYHEKLLFEKKLCQLDNWYNNLYVFHVYILYMIVVITVMAGDLAIVVHSKLNVWHYKMGPWAVH